MGKIVDSLNRIIVAHGGAAVEGSKADVVRAFIKQEEGYEIPASYDTLTSKKARLISPSPLKSLAKLQPPIQLLLRRVAQSVLVTQ